MPLSIVILFRGGVDFESMISSDLTALMRACEPENVVSPEDTGMSLPVLLHHKSMFVPSWYSLYLVII